jgi:hypothetical protein
MNRFQKVMLGVATAFAALAAVRLRLAPVLDARVSSVSAGSPQQAHVALSYGAGTRPDSLIVDVLGPDGGSATIGGEQLFVSIPVLGSDLGSGLRITAVYNLFGRVVERDFHFA